MMVNGSSNEDEYRLDQETVERLLDDLTRRFPGVSPEFILDVIRENQGRYDGILKELSSTFGQPAYPHLDHARINSAPSYQSSLMRPTFDRSSSDVTGLAHGNGRTTLYRTHDPDLNRSSIVSHLRLQQESFLRMQEKVYALRKDAARIQDEIHREEEELNTRSKVQKNPTEKDVEKLRREIEILTKEVQEANNKLERIRGGINSGTNSPIRNSSPPVRLPAPQSPQQVQYPPNGDRNCAHINPFSPPRFPIPNHPNLPPVHPYDELPGKSGEPHRPITENNLIGAEGWSCPRCTYINHPDMQKCEMCDKARNS